MKAKHLFLLLSVCLLGPGCAHKAGQAGVAPAADSIVSKPEEVPVDQSAGLLIIDTLSKVWGDDPSVAGGFIGDRRCPPWLEGMYFDGAVLVFQVWGDTLRARRELERVSGGTAFRLEQVRDTLFSQKQLDALMDTLRRRWDKADPVVRANVMGYGTGLHTLDVDLILDTPERRQAFRKELLDSPALRFWGATGKEPCHETGTADTLGVTLVPESPAFPAGSETVAFLLHNGSREKVVSGEHYKLAYERAGRWYWLPINSVAVDMANVTPTGGTYRFTACLHPLVNDNRPGRYRFFTRVTIEGAEVPMMAEFRLE